METSFSVNHKKNHMIQELEIMLECAKRAESLIHEKKQIEVSQKLDGEVVTNLDIAINRETISIIQKVFPKDPIIGEEKSVNDLVDSNRFWLVDPIDGTNSFIANKKDYTFIINLIEKKRPVLGLVYSFFDGHAYILRESNGVHIFKNNSFYKIHPTIVRKNNLIWNDNCSTKLKCAIMKNMGFVKTIYTESWGQRTVNFINGLGSCMISLHRSSKIWDTAIASLAISEIGGIITDLEGGIIKYNKNNRINEKGICCTFGIDHFKLLNVIKNFISLQ